MPAGGLPGRLLERVTGIEPASRAWKASALPLSYTRELGDHEPIIGDERVRGGGRWTAGRGLGNGPGGGGAARHPPRRNLRPAGVGAISPTHRRFVGQLIQRCT